MLEVRGSARTLSQSGVVSFVNYLVDNEALGCKLIRCFHSVEGSELAYVREIWSVAQSRSFCRIDTLEAELNLMANDDEGEVSSPLRDLFDLYLLYAFLGQTNWTCLLMLATTILEACGSEVHVRALSLQSMAETLRVWTDQEIENNAKIVKAAPSYMETNVLLGIGGVSLSGVRGLVELLKMMPQETILLSKSLRGATDRQLYLVASVLTQFGVMDQGLFELKQAIDLPGGPIASAAVALAGMTKVPITSPIKKPSRAALALTEAVAPAPSVIPVSDLKVNAEGARLVLKAPPSANTVYHKLLKPFPTVSVEGIADLSKCVVVAELLRYEGPNAEPFEPLHYLEGEKVISASGGVAIFRKLKINTTTTSVGNQFILRFSLARNNNGSIVPVAGLSVLSEPLNVFSHSSYLKDKDSAPKPKEKKRKKFSDDELDSDE